MKGVLLRCLIYTLLPVALLYLFSLLSSGLPLVPIMIGICAWWSHREL